MGFTISTTSNCGLTLISNSFIQNHMPSANGNFVKIYLYLVMLCQHADTAGNSSIDALADCFECTESDILRALRYWQKEGFLSQSKMARLLRLFFLLTPQTLRQQLRQKENRISMLHRQRKKPLYPTASPFRTARSILLYKRKH